ncbi:MogA/MoaB family molybdenum cofactor biosynthesis protein [Listeria rustica]|uniref:Molybdenum cofactor biosynthesis protein B n=1 Tax=Listeria rustica TaxID=2713503 RepID=A0A7W1T9F0_9LIST|nr:molybdenum cofactor biosynthesis protein B [Listeria rustica]MBA3927839.1 molybdenum cofactor biosynthesis protein MoaB [Listeria rustica]
MEQKEFIQARVGILTISDTRNLETDKSGLLLVDALETAGHTVVERLVVKDDDFLINEGLAKLKPRCDCVISNGGTGIAVRDVTFEALWDQVAQEIPGFGELFRMLSYKEIGTRAMLSRAFAGFTLDNVLLFVVPGSTHACELAVNQLIIPELPHFLAERRK